MPEYYTKVKDYYIKTIGPFPFAIDLCISMEKQKIKTFVIEDDPIIMEVVRQYVELCPSLEWIGEAIDHPRALPLVREMPIDLLISDIETRLVNGLDFFRSLHFQPLVIFITSHPEYAVESFDVEAVDFLVKPFGLARFQKAINRVENKLFPLHENGSVPKESVPVGSDFTYIRSENQFVKVVFDEILYVEGLKDYCRIVLENGSQHLTWMNLKGIEDSFPSQFLRVHKSYIINRKKIKMVGAETLYVGRNEIPFGHTYKAELMEEVNRNVTRR